MAGDDFSHLSDEELATIASSKPTAPTNDYSHISDEELAQIASQATPTKTKSLYGGKYPIQIPENINPSDPADAIARAAGAGAEYIDRYTGAPVRAFVSNYENGKNLPESLSAAYDQFGKPANPEYSGKAQELRAQKAAGVPNTSLSDVFPSVFSEKPVPENPLQPEKGGKLDISSAGAWGIARDIVENPLTYFGMVGGPQKTSQTIKAGVNALSPGDISGLSEIAANLKSIPKANAEEIAAASQRLGFNPTVGMIDQNPVVQGIESSLVQSPSIFSSGAKKANAAVYEGLANKAGELTNAPQGLTKFESGEAVKSGLAAKTNELIAPAQMAYDDLEKVFADTPVSERVIKIAQTKINKLNGVRLTPGSAADGLATNIKSWMQNVETIEDAKNLRTILGKMRTPGMSASEKQVLDEGYDTLTRLRDNAIRTKTFRNASQRAAIQDTIQGADKTYREFFDKVEPIDRALGGRPSRTPTEFLNKLEETPSEALHQKLFNANNFDALKQLKGTFPEQFETLKNQRLLEIVDKSKTSGEVDPVKLLNNTKALGPEVRSLLFGEKSNQIMKDMQTVVDNIPKKMGPSGTPQGLEFSNLLSPRVQIEGYAKNKLLNKIRQDSPIFNKLNTNPESANKVLFGGRK